MPTFWPFNKKRRSISLAVKDPEQPQISGKQPPRSPRPFSPTPPVPRRSSKRGSQRKRPASPTEKASEAQYLETKKRQGSRGKDTMSRRRGSIEQDITALPISKELQSSPHLRPVDLDRPAIPYNFRQHSDSQTSIQRQDVTSRSSRPQTLRSRRSGYDSSTPQRRRSSKRPKGDALREEEIRAMTATPPVSKRPGEGPLRRDSKKQRSGKKGSAVSLPMEDSIHSSMSGIQEHRGWEVGFLDVFNPRPAVRLSGTPQYVHQSSLVVPPPSEPLTKNDSKFEKERNKRPVTKDSSKKRQTIGDRADHFDASDLRMLLERDAKRREKRKKEQQEKLDRKLKNRNGRNRGDSDRRRHEAEDTSKAEEAKQFAEAERRGRELITPPDDVHPAFRERPITPTADADVEKIGLGIGASAVAAEAVAGEQRSEQRMLTPEEPKAHNTGTYLQYGPKADDGQDPFADPVPSPAPQERELASPGPFETPLGSPMEEAVLSTAQEVDLSQPGTPPLSPVQTTQSARITSGLAYGQRSSDLPEPPTMPSDRRTSEPRDRRAGAWASLFRRGGTNLRKTGDDAQSSSDFSFSNTSRESMRNQPLPAHLVDTHSSQRSKSGTPVRTQSKFREDLPEMPISPPDSRMPSPDVTMAAAHAAAARRAMRSPHPVDIPGARSKDAESETQNHGRSDTPISPSARSHGLMSASLASVDSEGSWLANSAKRQSGQSALSRGVGSLSKRKPEFNASYEELGGDKDAEYFRRVSAASAVPGRSSAIAGASPDAESVYSEPAPTETPTEPLTVHGSVRRQPTLVRRDPRVKSREGLLTEYSAEVEEPEDSPGRDEFDLDDSTKSHVRSARSVDLSRGHARGISAGSAKLLDIPPKRPSMDQGSAGGSPGTSVPPPASKL